MSKTANEAARRLMEMQIPPERVADMSELSGVQVEEGKTYGNLLKAKTLAMARDGDKKAADLVRRYGITGGGGGE